MFNLVKINLCQILAHILLRSIIDKNIQFLEPAI